MGSENYPLRPLSDLVTIHDSKRIPVRKSDRKPGPYPYYGASGIVDYVESYIFDGEYLLLAEDGENLKTQDTPIAFMARGRFWVNNHAHILEGNNGNNTLYLCSALQIADVNSCLSGSTRPKLTQGDMKRILVSAPLPDTQRAIAHILGSLDDKIELNRQMNRTLEKMAQAIFKSWFIDFDPVRRNAARAQNQPSPPAPLPEVEGRKKNYRGGFDFSGLVKIARELRQKQTPAEEIFWSIVRNRQFMGLKFRRQHQIGEYVADFYCHEEKTVIELDGGIHAQKKKRDAKRDAWMKAQGFNVLRFPNEQLLDDSESVLNQIAQMVEGSVPSSSPSGRGGGEGVVGSEAFDHLFPDSFEDSELGEIPKGWEVKPIGDVIEIYDSKRIPLSRREREKRTGPYPYYGATSIMDYVDDYIFDGIYTLIGEDGSVINEDGTPFMQYVWGKIWVNNHAHVLQGKSYISTEHIYVHLSQANVGAYVTGAVQLKINQGNLKRIPFIRPTEDVAIMFGDVLKRYYSQYRNNVEESRTLSTLRDTLLPKLISGELRVPDAEKFIEEAGV